MVRVRGENKLPYIVRGAKVLIKQSEGRKF
jgi:hypothetical protein